MKIVIASGSPQAPLPQSSLKRNRNKSAFIAAMLAAFIGTSAMAGAQTILYSQLFTNNSGSSELLSAVGWNLNYTTSATADTTDTLISANLGSDGTKGAVGVNLDPTSGTAVESANNLPYLLWTSSIQSSSIDISTVSNISYASEVPDGNVTTLRLAVDIGSTWYATATTISTPIGSSFTTQTLTLSGLTWDTLNFTNGSTLTLGSATTLPTSGIINDIGFYTSSGDAISSLIKLDTLEVLAVPESPTVAMFLMGCGLIGVLLWEKRRLGKMASMPL